MIVQQNNLLIWESPIEWQVIDLALGDPNDDGRFELLLIVNKQDESSRLTNHPFVIGFRNGLFRQLWGGSAVADPIREVELGDLDGDGVQELIVIETQKSGKEAIAVWNWHGWGFSLVWRSPEARYEDLTVVSGASGRRVISVGKVW